MSERPATDAKGGVDREIGLRGLLGFTAGLIALLALTGVLMWWLSLGLREARVAADPPPPMLPEARQPFEPPAPRLQADPPSDMATLRAEESRQLSTWRWSDESEGLAQVPIERAMELFVEERAGEGGGS